MTTISADEIPDFLKRTETPEQVEERRKQYAPKDMSGGLKVVQPPEPKDPKIAAAIAKDFIEKGGKAQKAVDGIVWKRTQDSLRNAQNERRGKKTAADREKAGLPPIKAPKKAGKLVERALKVREQLLSVSAAKKEEATVKTKKKTEKANGKSKMLVIADLLKRKDGCTTADVLKATGWPSVSMPAQAKAAGLKLRKDKKAGEATRYFGS